MAILCPHASSIVVETQVTVLAKHTACALNQTHQTLSLLMKKVDQMKKVFLEN